MHADHTSPEGYRGGEGGGMHVRFCMCEGGRGKPRYTHAIVTDNGRGAFAVPRQIEQPAFADPRKTPDYSIYYFGATRLCELPWTDWEFHVKTMLRVQ